MHDMLTRLYEIPDDWSFIREQEKKGVTIRKPMGTEKHVIIEWVKRHFQETWASEVDRSLCQMPMTCFIAVKDKAIIGFASYDSVALGVFGPTGVLEGFRRKGTGTALLLAALLDMKLKGYGYAIIGGVGPAEYYRKVIGAEDIPNSTPGLWKNWVESGNVDKIPGFAEKERDDAGS
jgi:hypothetical protein